MVGRYVLDIEKNGKKLRYSWEFSDDSGWAFAIAKWQLFHDDAVAQGCTILESGLEKPDGNEDQRPAVASDNKKRLAAHQRRRDAATG